MIEGSFDLEQHLSDANVVESEIDRRLKNIDQNESNINEKLTKLQKLKLKIQQKKLDSVNDNKHLSIFSNPQKINPDDENDNTGLLDQGNTIKIQDGINKNLKYNNDRSKNSNIDQNNNNLKRKRIPTGNSDLNTNKQFNKGNKSIDRFGGKKDKKQDIDNNKERFIDIDKNKIDNNNNNNK